LCVFPAKFAKTRKLNQTFAYNDKQDIKMFNAIPRNLLAKRVCLAWIDIAKKLWRNLSHHYLHMFFCLTLGRRSISSIDDYVFPIPILPCQRQRCSTGATTLLTLLAASISLRNTPWVLSCTRNGQQCWGSSKSPASRPSLRTFSKYQKSNSIFREPVFYRYPS